MTLPRFPECLKALTFVAPFDGILNSNALSSGGSTLDVAAVVAFVGWTILELIVLWAVGIFRREPA